MARKRRTKRDVSSTLMRLAKNGTLVLAGFGIAEYAGRLIGQQVPQVNTPIGKVLTKAALGVGLVMVAGRGNRAEAALAATGMVANGVKDAAVTYLPGELSQNLSGQSIAMPLISRFPVNGQGATVGPRPVQVSRDVRRRA